MITKPSALTLASHAETEGQITSATSKLSLWRGMGGGGEGQGTSCTSSLTSDRRVGQNTSETSILTANPGIGNNITNMMGMSSTNNLGLGNNITNTMGMSSTNNLGLGSNISNLAVSRALAGEGQDTSDTRSLAYMESIIGDSQNTSSTNSLAFNDILGSNMSNMLGSSSMSNLGLGSNMNNQAVSLTLDGVGQGASGTSSLRSNMSSLNFSRQIAGRGQNMSGTSSLSFNDKTGASGGDMARGTGRASGMKRDEFTARAFLGFSPWNDSVYSKSLVQINQGQSALGLIDVINLGSLTNFSHQEFRFNSFRDQRYHFEKQPHFLDEVASRVFPSSDAANNAHLDRLKSPILLSPLHQNEY